ncbi:MAG: SIMPL domain-containing protein [Rhodocyclaceae bacterium]|nr:SIMPL domain-containing protein [Rhodocyclaceae bacterium]MDZ4213361.1 SIMPL domain-containing protein [Rhodocyclaceae bacterium]
MKRTLLLFAFATLPVWAAEPTKPAGTLIDFRVDVQKSVANDLGRATAYSEITGSDAAEVARKVKAAIADGLATAKAQAGVTVKSGNTHTYPVYSKGGRTIESWRMRSEIILESRDAGALSTAVGKLQGSLAVSNINFSPAAETRRKAEDEATLEAIDAFRTKAERIAATMKKPYRIRQMSVNGSHQYPQPYPVARGAMLMAAESAPMPVEAGESNITVNINGQIELAE